MTEHITRTYDTLDYLGVRGTTAKCSCGWSDEWNTRDGSAEMSASEHTYLGSEKYLAAKAREREEDLAAGCICEQVTFISGRISTRYLAECPVHNYMIVPPRMRETSTPVPVAAPEPVHDHGCSCIINPPCDACVECEVCNNAE